MHEPEGVLPLLQAALLGHPGDMGDGLVRHLQLHGTYWPIGEYPRSPKLKARCDLETCEDQFWPNHGPATAYAGFPAQLLPPNSAIATFSYRTEAKCPDTGNILV